MAPITFYTFKTPNGYKISIFLELLGLQYKVKNLDISTNVQKEPWFLELNPNGRIPTIVDHSTGITISETGAILQYLADTYDKDHLYSYEHGTKEYYKYLEILTFAIAGQGPMQGQANHFSLYAPEKIPYGIKRYTEETKRLYSVLDLYLERSKGPYLVGDRLTGADVSVFGWAVFANAIGVDLEQFPRVWTWAKLVAKIPEVQKGLAVPEPRPIHPGLI